MGQPAARVGDMHTCPMVDVVKPHVGGPILPPGKINVLIGGMPAATVTNLCTCASFPDMILQGAYTTLIGGMPAARMGDMTLHGGIITIGNPTVLIGGPSMSMMGMFDAVLNSLKDFFAQKMQFLAKGLLELVKKMEGLINDTIDFALGVAVGFVKGAVSTLTALAHLIQHPIDTVNGIVNAIVNYDKTYEVAKEALAQTWDTLQNGSPEEKGEVVGKAFEFVAEMFVGGELVKIGTSAEAAGGMVKVAEGVEGAETAAKMGKVGEDVANIGKIGEKGSELSKIEKTEEILSIKTATSASEELKNIGNIAGKSKAEIENSLKQQGFNEVSARSGGSVWTKAMPDGNTAAVRIDPPTYRNPAKGYADEVPHAHKEIVSTSSVQNGNYDISSPVTKLDDLGEVTRDKGRMHIPIQN